MARSAAAGAGGGRGAGADATLPAGAVHGLGGGGAVLDCCPCGAGRPQQCAARADPARLVSLAAALRRLPALQSVSLSLAGGCEAQEQQPGRLEAGALGQLPGLHDLHVCLMSPADIAEFNRAASGDSSSGGGNSNGGGGGSSSGGMRSLSRCSLSWRCSEPAPESTSLPGLASLPALRTLELDSILPLEVWWCQKVEELVLWDVELRPDHSLVDAHLPAHRKLELSCVNFARGLPTNLFTSASGLTSMSLEEVEGWEGAVQRCCLCYPRCLACAS